MYPFVLIASNTSNWKRKQTRMSVKKRKVVNWRTSSYPSTGLVFLVLPPGEHICSVNMCSTALHWSLHTNFNVHQAQQSERKNRPSTFAGARPDFYRRATQPVKSPIGFIGTDSDQITSSQRLTDRTSTLSSGSDLSYAFPGGGWDSAAVECSPLQNAEGSEGEREQQ